ncbi:site-specific integrase [Rhodoblastus sp. 17X3]|uniref:site-specific integrase n=1 Tax=Rhodoblastus sp. 17X3 TaxID=3047026 RepID=UPI0024B64A3C|nr:site-specific integrase [Rhodoblastus sp. 17X3]MDI9849161.1 site-specific integrase [Rhodoblastus sp. 17X3]
MSNIVRRGAVYYFRRRVPAKIQAILGQKVIRESLGERDPKIARRKAAERALFWEREFAKAEAQLSAKSPQPQTRAELSEAEIAAILAGYRRHLLWSDEQIRLRGLGGQDNGLPDHQYDLLTEVLQDIEQFAADGIARGRALSPANRDTMDAYLGARGLRLDPSSRAYERVAIGFLHTRAECIQLWKDRHAGKIVETPSEPENPTSSVAASPNGISYEPLTLESLINGWKNERKPVPKTVDTFTQKLRKFEKYLNGRDLGSATPEDASKWKAKRLEEGNSPKSVLNDIHALKALFGWALENHKIAVNPFAKVRLLIKKKNTKKKRSYTDEEVKLILLTARSKKGGARWIPWIEATMGVRVNEAAQINRDDVKMIRNIACIEITDLFDDDDDEEEENIDGEDKSVKTESSRRTVPIPEFLIAEGFMKFVAGKKPGEPLFPDMKPDTYGHRGGTASKRVCRIVRVNLGIKDKRVSPNHSFRHWYKDLCRNSGINEEVHDALTGHAGKSEGRKYGDGFVVETLAPTVARLNWGRLNLG